MVIGIEHAKWIGVYNYLFFLMIPSLMVPDLDAFCCQIDQHNYQYYF